MPQYCSEDLSTQHLKRALAALHDHKPAVALDALLAAWASAPSPALAACITTASRLAADGVPASLAALTEGAWRDARAQLIAMRKWRPDPRVDEQVTRILETLPYRVGAEKFYVELADRAAKIHDPALIARIAAVRTDIDWLAPIVAKLKKKLKPKKPVKLNLRAIETALAAATASPATQRDDARDELIALQSRPKLAPADRKRESALLKEHGDRWLGAIAAILSDFTFERGYLATCTVDPNKEQLAPALAGNPAWSTVHTLADATQIMLHPVMTALRALELRPSRIHGHDVWRELYAGRKRPIERLHVTDLDDASPIVQIDLLGQAKALPALRELVVGGAVVRHHAALLGSPVAKRVETLVLVFASNDDRSVEVFASLARAKTKRVVVRQGDLTLTLERGKPGYDRVAVELSRDLARATRLIAALPKTLRELRVTTTGKLDRSARTALKNALRGRKLAVCELP